ncbi:hypothetical protein D3C75_1023410 [compost metagenome]
MHGDRQQRAPQPGQRRQHQRAAADDPQQVALADRQQVAEQVGHQVDAHLVEQADGHQTERQGAVGEDAEQGVGGQRLALLQGHQQHGEQHTADGHRQGRADVEQKAQRHAEQRGMGEGVAEVGHAPPDHEGAERAGDQRQGEAGEQGVEEEVGHGQCLQFGPWMWGCLGATTLPCRSCWWSCWWW